VIGRAGVSYIEAVVGAGGKLIPGAIGKVIEKGVGS
jgi:hypothetical protein